MKISNLFALSVVAMIACGRSAVAQTPVGSELTYQGRLSLGGTPLNDSADFEFTLWDSDIGGNMIGSVVAAGGVPVVDGVFTVEIDFGVMAFNGDARWLEIHVRSPSGSGAFTALSPRQLLTAAPYALRVPGIDGHSLDAADGAPQDAVFVSGSGNVGIRTTSPAARLDISDANVNSALRIQPTSLGPNLIYKAHQGGTKDMNIRFESAAGVQTEVMTFKGNDSTGWIGVGTTSPQEDFHIQGRDQLTTLLVSGDGDEDDLAGLRLATSPTGAPAFELEYQFGRMEISRIDSAGEEMDVMYFQENGDIRFVDQVNPGVVQINATMKRNGYLSLNAGLSPDNRLDVASTISGADSEDASYVVHFENKSDVGFPDVLLLEVGVPNPGIGSNFVQFVAGDACAGSISGNSAGGVIYATAGCDFAEELLRRDQRETIEAGDVVGVFGGKISRITDGADWVMAVSTAPGILGKAYDEANDLDLSDLSEMVAFVGQVPIKVRGPVALGDYVVASGRNDGTAIAVSPHDLSIDRHAHVVGRAWESSSDDDVKLVNTVVGLPDASGAAALVETTRRQASEIDSLRHRLAELESLVTALAINQKPGR